MLSYRHSFHAGNFADVLKHIVLVEILTHLTLKETPFEYIDTHAGAGLYHLKSSNAQKLQEHTNGIGKLNARDFPEIGAYFAAVQSFNQAAELNYYPGSPMLANVFLRSQDRAWLFELHPQDYQLLHKTMTDGRRVRVRCENGFDGLKAVLPPTSGRGLVLIDPSYEVKTDYDEVIDRTIAAHKKFSRGIYAIWYPVVNRLTIQNMERRLVKSGINNIQRFELGLAADTTARGMTSAGIFVINPPWTLFDKMATLLPKLAQKLAEGDRRFYKCEIITKE